MIFLKTVNLLDGIFLRRRVCYNLIIYYIYLYIINIIIVVWLWQFGVFTLVALYVDGDSNVACVHVELDSQYSRSLQKIQPQDSAAVVGGSCIGISNATYTVIDIQLICYYTCILVIRVSIRWFNCKNLAYDGVRFLGTWRRVVSFAYKV